MGCRFVVVLDWWNGLVGGGLGVVCPLMGRWVLLSCLWLLLDSVINALFLLVVDNVEVQFR